VLNTIYLSDTFDVQITINMYKGLYWWNWQCSNGDTRWQREQYATNVN